MKIFVEKISRLWTTHEIFTARGDKICERFEDTSVIQIVASYAKILPRYLGDLENYSA